MSSDPTVGPLICGTASYVDGTYVWTDYAYDDTGASASELGGGVEPYPEDGANTADLIQLQLRLTDDGLLIRAVLQTLNDPSVPVLAVGFDTDCDPATGAPGLPGGRWLAEPPLGLERVVIVSGDSGGGELRQYADGGWHTSATFPATIDPSTNVLETTVPRTVLDPARATWRVVAALGIMHDGASFLDGPGAIYDLAFVGNESPARPRGAGNAWQDRDQADILSGRYPSDHAVATIDFDLLARGENVIAEARAPGTHTFLYRSNLELGGGIQPWPRKHNPELWTKFGMPAPPSAPWKIHAGTYQPYGVWIPERLPSPAPLIVFLHGTGSNHLSNASRSFFGPGRFDVPAIVVEPLGRGGSCGYYGPAEQDVLDVMDDITARFEIDEDRVILTGISQGGFATFRIGELYPDRFSALIPLVGQSALVPEIEMMISGGEPFMPDTLENLCNVPIRMINGRLDPQKNAFAGNVPDLDALALQKLEYEFRYWQLLRRGHEVIPELTNGVFLEVLDLPRDSNPARVVFSVEPFLDACEPDTKLELRHDSAYWVSGVTVRGDNFQRGDKGTVDATTLARADRVRVPRPYAIVSGNTQQPRDLVGPNPQVHGFDEWVEQGITFTPGAPQPVENGFTTTFTRVATVTFDLDRMGLDPARELTATVTGDGRTDLHLVGKWGSAVEVTTGSSSDVVTPDGDTLTLSRDFRGEQTLVIRPRSA